MSIKTTYRKDWFRLQSCCCSLSPTSDPNQIHQMSGQAPRVLNQFDSTSLGASAPVFHGGPPWSSIWPYRWDGLRLVLWNHNFYNFCVFAWFKSTVKLLDSSLMPICCTHDTAWSYSTSLHLCLLFPSVWVILLPLDVSNSCRDVQELKPNFGVLLQVRYKETNTCHLHGWTHCEMYGKAGLSLMAYNCIFRCSENNRVMVTDPSVWLNFIDQMVA